MTDKVFKSRKNFRNFIANEGQVELESLIDSKLQILSVSEESTEEHADIIAVCNSYEKTIIECELKQNIKTFANLLKYASGHNAKHIIWLVNQEAQEAVETVSWVSKYLNFNVQIYIIKCHLNSDKIAFKELLKPSANVYKKTKKITPTKEKQAEFWEEFEKFTIQNNSSVKISQPAPQHWQYIPIGMAGVSIQLTINTNKKNLGCELLIAKDKELFYKLEEFKNDIEKQLGNLEWQALEGKKSSRIKTTLDFDIENKDSLENAFKWLINTTDKFKDVFTRYLK